MATKKVYLGRGRTGGGNRKPKPTIRAGIASAALHKNDLPAVAAAAQLLNQPHAIVCGVLDLEPLNQQQRRDIIARSDAMSAIQTLAELQARLDVATTTD
jgi:hypothetical protein